MRTNRLFLSIIVTFAASVCCAVAIATSLDIRGPLFKFGHPCVKNESLNEAVVPASQDDPSEMETLKDSLEIIRLSPGLYFEISGHTDSNECAKFNCEQLSLRRAQLVYDYLVENGIPESQLLQPIGRSDQRQVTSSIYGNGDDLSRRVDIHPKTFGRPK